MDITESKREGLEASTSKPCRWNQPRKRRLSPRKAHQLLSLKHDNNNEEEQVASAVNVSSFAAKLQACAPRAGWLVNFTAPDSELEEETLPNIPEPEFMFADYTDISSNCCKDTFASFKENVKLSAEEITKIEIATRNQASSQVWHQLRAGRLTSSHFGDVFRRKACTKPDNLLKVVMGYQEVPDNVHVAWGTKKEVAARRAYLLHMQPNHAGISVRTSGLIVSEDLPYLASSPDGLVHCPHCMPSQGLLEIKCPSVHRDKTPMEAAKDKSFFCEIVDDKVTLKRSHKYYFQVQGQMGVSGKTWCDFFVWTMKGCTVERIHFDENLWKEMVQKLTIFYLEAVEPEIFTQRVKRGLHLYG